MYFLKKDRYGNHVLTKEGERLYQQIVRPPRQHGKPRRFHPPRLAASRPA